MGTEVAIGIVVAMLSIGLFLVHHRKNKDKKKKEFFVPVGDESIVDEAFPDKPAKTETATPNLRSICTPETKRAFGGRNIVPVVKVYEKSSSRPMYEV